MNNQHASCDEQLRRTALERNELQDRADFAENLADRMNARIVAILDLHRPWGGTCYACCQSYPCDTVKAARGDRS